MVKVEENPNQTYDQVLESVRFVDNLSSPIVRSSDRFAVISYEQSTSRNLNWAQRTSSYDRCLLSFTRSQRLRISRPSSFFNDA